MRLADTSAWVWTRAIGGQLRGQFDEEVFAGEIAACAMVKLELLYSARNHDDFVRLNGELHVLPQRPLDASVWDRALAVHGDLARDQ